MPGRKLTPANAATLVKLLATSASPVGFAADRKTLCVTVGQESYMAPIGHTTATQLVTLLQASNRQAWAIEPLHITVDALLAAVPGFDVRAIRNATAAEAAVIGNPAERLATNPQNFVAALAPKTDPVTGEKPRGPRGKFVPAFTSAQGMSRLAAETAARLSQMDEPIRMVALRAVELDRMWRARLVRGWEVDLDQVLALAEQDEAARVDIHLEAGIDLADSDSGAGMDAALRWLSEVGLHPTEGGRPSTSRDALDALDATGEAEHRRKLIRKAKSIASSIQVTNQLRKAYRNGSVKTEMRLFAARTGRTSIRRSSLQNIRADRRGLLGARPGYTLVTADLAQCEIRIAAALSGDKALARALHTDVYRALACSVYGIQSESQVTVEQRAAAKQALIAVLYGQGSALTAHKLGITVDAAKTLIAGVWAAYPELAAFRNELVAGSDVARKTVTLGRPVPPILSRKHIALNTAVQSEGADILQTRAQVVAEALGEDALWLQLHDELVVEVPIVDEELASAALRLMFTPFLGVPMTGEVTVLGSRWRKA
jgi:hypothetical protein